jgi:hypothetical protein
MSAYVVCYDLLKQGQNYNCLTDKIKSFGTYWNTQQSVWIVISQQSAEQIREYLTPCLEFISLRKF